ncbi:MAG: glycosyltransferase family 4 protein [bacterium]
MRILIINYEFPPLGGGGGIASYQMGKELVKKHRVEVLTSGYKDLPRSEEKDGLIIHRVPVLQRDSLFTASLLSIGSFIPSSIKRGFSLLKNEKFDIIHSYFAFPSGITGVILSRHFKIPHITTIIGGEIIGSTRYKGERASLGIQLIPFKTAIFKWLLLWVLQNSKKIAISNDVANGVYDYLKTSLDIKIIPLSVQIPYFQKKTREELGFSKDDFLIVSVCRLVKRKGLDYLIQAVSSLRDKRIKILIIGDGIEKQNLLQLAKKLDISDQVIFLGFLTEEVKFQYLSISDIFILTSLHEGFGIVYLEGMSCGLPVIASDNGGQTDFIIEGENGFLIPVADVDKLSQRIIELIENKELRDKISEVNIKKAQEFSITKEAQKYEEIYKSVLG